MYKLHVNLVSTKLIFLTYISSLLSVNNSYNSYIDVNYDIVHPGYYIKYTNLWRVETMNWLKNNCSSKEIKNCIYNSIFITVTNKILALYI